MGISKATCDNRVIPLNSVAKRNLLLVNAFFIQSTALHFAMSVIGVLVFTGLTAWDTQRIKNEYAEHHGGDTLAKMAILGALGLYMNFINMFLMLLTLFGNRD